MQRCQSRLGQVFRGALHQAAAGIGNDQPYALKATVDEVVQKCRPAGFVFLGALADAQNLPKTLTIDGAGHQQRDIADFAGPGALHHDAIEIEIRMLAFDGPVPPGLDLPINLLVEVRHRRRRNPRPPQRFRDVLDTPHRNARQIHLDQGLLDRALPPPVSFNDRRLKGLVAQASVSSDRTSPALGLQHSARSGPRAYRDGPRCARNAPASAKPVRLSVQQWRSTSLQQCPRTNPSRWLLNPLVVNRDDIAQRTRLYSSLMAAPSSSCPGCV